VCNSIIISALLGTITWDKNIFQKGILKSIAVGSATNFLPRSAKIRCAKTIIYPFDKLSAKLIRAFTVLVDTNGLCLSSFDKHKNNYFTNDRNKSYNSFFTYYYKNVLNKNIVAFERVQRQRKPSAKKDIIDLLDSIAEILASFSNSLNSLLNFLESIPILIAGTTAIAVTETTLAGFYMSSCFGARLYRETITPQDIHRLIKAVKKQGAVFAKKEKSLSLCQKAYKERRMLLALSTAAMAAIFVFWKSKPLK
jgi:hypothetical protein